MVNIAIVEDDSTYRELLQNYLVRYSQQNNEQFRISVFQDGYEVVSQYDGSWDILLMDVQMKHMDGMRAAQLIRKRDKNVVIIFITNLAQYAVLGYQVEAMDYILKPIQYFDFSQGLMKAIKKIHERSSFYVRIMQESGMIRLDAANITYLESQGNIVLFHTVNGGYSIRGTLKAQEDQLHSHHFFRCNNCYLVNLAHVEKVDKQTVTVFGDVLQISRPRYKGFMEALAAYVGGE